jgi:diadenosine tetraphosphate (Ap4A) HIT family hydrolase
MTAAPSGCVFCALSQKVYLESPRWLLMRHADPVPLAGWMMVAARAHRGGLDELDADEGRELGRVLASVATAVRAETGCERTYSITFNEAVRHLHLHVIPRHASDASTTSWALADRYRATARGEVAAASPEDAERTAQAVAARCRRDLADLGFAAPAGGSR